jgi:hypothetical protein
VQYLKKKDLLAKTSGPPLRVAAMHISRRISEVDEEIKNQLSLGAT